MSGRAPLTPRRRAQHARHARPLAPRPYLPHVVAHGLAVEHKRPQPAARPRWSIHAALRGLLGGRL